MQIIKTHITSYLHPCGVPIHQGYDIERSTGMTIHVSSFPREKRRKIAREAIRRVREQGIHKTHTKYLMACLFGLATQDQMKDLVRLDSWVLEELEPATTRAGRFYEEVRQELVFRVYTGQGVDQPKFAPPEFDTIQWTVDGQKQYRKEVYSLWEQDPDNDEFAMLFTLSCMSYESWAWRMHIWHARGEIITPSERLRKVALRTAGKRRFDCLVQGLDYLEYEGSQQAKKRMEAPWDDENAKENDPEELRWFRMASKWER